MPSDLNSPLLLLVGDAVRLGRVLSGHGRLRTVVDPERAAAVLRAEDVALVVASSDDASLAVLDAARRIRPGIYRVRYADEADAAAGLAAIAGGALDGVFLASWPDELIGAAVDRLLDRQRTGDEAAVALGHVREERSLLDLANEELARQLDERTRALRLAQQVLEHLPLPVLGIDCDGAVVLVNEAAGLLFTHLGPALFGLPVDSVLPEEAVDAAASAVLGDEDREVLCVIQELPCRLHIRTLYDGPSPRGCLIVFEGAAVPDEASPVSSADSHAAPL